MTTTISFSRSLYDEGAIRHVAELFSEVVTIDIACEHNEINAAIGEYDGAIDELCDEFKNHALYESIVRSRASDAGENA